MSTVERQELKQAIKEAIKEAMMENSEMVKEIVAEALEDIALLQRMEEGRQTEMVSRDDVMEFLEPER